MDRSDPIYLSPVHGDTVRRGPNTYRVTGRGVADSVRFVRLTTSGMSLAGQKALSCWQRLVANAQVVERGAR